MGLFDNPLDHCEKNAQWETVTEAVDPNNLVRCRRSDVEQLQSENELLRAKCARYEKALREIEKGEGAFSRDPLEHAENTIDNMKDIARQALERKPGQDSTATNDRAFIEHIQQHLEPGQEVICKICGKTAKEIIAREEEK